MGMNIFQTNCRNFCNLEAIKCLGLDSLIFDSNSQKNIIDYFTDDIEVLTKRSLVFADTLNIKGCYEFLESITKKLFDIKELIRSESEFGNKERSIFSIKQLQLYFEIIDEASNFLSNSNPVFSASEYISLL